MEIMDILSALGGIQGSVMEKRKAEKEKEIEDLVTMLSKGFQPFEPTVKRTQTAEQFMGPPQRIGGQFASGAPTIGLNAPVAPPPFEDFLKTGQLGLPPATFRGPQMQPLPTDVFRLPEKVGGSAFWRKTAGGRLPRPTEKPVTGHEWKEKLTTNTTGNIISTWDQVKVGGGSSPAISLGRLSQSGSKAFSAAQSAIEGGKDYDAVINALNLATDIPATEKPIIIKNLKKTKGQRDYSMFGE